MYRVALRDAIRDWVLVQGRSQRSAARQFGVCRDTVARLLRERFSSWRARGTAFARACTARRGGRPRSEKPSRAASDLPRQSRRRGGKQRTPDDDEPTYPGGGACYAEIDEPVRQDAEAPR